MKTDNNNKSFSRASLLNFDSFYDDTKYEWYAAKHRKPSPAELSLVNGLSIECCPHCGGTHFKKSGYYSNGTRRYRCLDCGRVFSPLTGTVFDAHKIPVSEWIEYMIHLFEFHSLSSSASDNRNAKTTGKYWILMCLSNYCQGSFDVFSWPLMLPCKRMHSFTWNAAGSVVLYYLQGYFMISSLVLVKSLR